jgi:hypothetical protein
MGSPDLLLVCVSAFVSVFVLLSLLAVVMRALIAVFPEKVTTTDSAVLAAVTAAVSAAYPGAKIKDIQEER